MRSIKAIFGANVKYYRKKMRLSQEQLAEKLDITAKHLSTIETGATFVSADLLEKITRQLLVSASSLFYSVDNMFVDDGTLTKMDLIIDNECSKMTNAIKIQMRHLYDQLPKM